MEMWAQTGVLEKTIIAEKRKQIRKKQVCVWERERLVINTWAIREMHNTMTSSNLNSILTAILLGILVFGVQMCLKREEELIQLHSNDDYSLGLSLRYKNRTYGLYITSS